MDQLIQNISSSTINSFFRSKIRSYRIDNDELDYLIPDNGYNTFSNLVKLGECTYENSDDLLVFSCRYEGELTARSSKKKQYDLAKKVLKDDFKDGALFIFYDNSGIFRFSFIRRYYDPGQEKFTPFNAIPILLIPINKTKPLNVAWELVLLNHSTPFRLLFRWNRFPNSFIRTSAIGISPH